jgi:hypothetical protein
MKQAFFVAVLLSLSVDLSLSLSLSAAAQGNSAQFGVIGGQIVFGNGIIINTRTGAVTIPDGTPLDDAARQFWIAARQFGAAPGCAGVSAP